MGSGGGVQLRNALLLASSGSLSLWVIPRKREREKDTETDEFGVKISDADIKIRDADLKNQNVGTKSVSF